MNTARLQARVRVVGFLGRALRYELSAVQQYMSHAALYETWYLSVAFRDGRVVSGGVLNHAVRIVDGMV